MKRVLLTLTVFGLTGMPAQSQEIELYSPSLTSAPEQLFGVDARGLSEQIKQAIMDETGASGLTLFRVHWSPPSFQCLRATNEFSPDESNAVCLVKATAFQLNATAQIVKKDDTISVSILSVMIE